MVRTRVMAGAAARLRALGIDPTELLQKFELPHDIETVGEVTIPLDSYDQFFNAVEEASGDAFFGLNLGQVIPRGHFGVLEFACRIAPSARESFRRIARYFRLLNDLTVIDVTDNEHETHIEERVPGRPLAMGRHGNEFFLAMLYAVARTYLPAWRVERVWFAHPAPADVHVLSTYFDAPISFGAGSNGFAVSSAFLDVPLPTYDGPLLAVLDEVAEKALAEKIDESPAFLVRVRRAIRDSFYDGAPTLAGLAKQMKTSSRTLQRRLAEEGSTFADEVDRARREVACPLVAESNRTLADIAFMIGFSDVSAFVRAFRRWTGTSPGRYREQARSRTSP